jgi:hypothetical protein
MAQAIETVVPSESIHELGATAETFLSMNIPPIGSEPTDVERAAADVRMSELALSSQKLTKKGETKIRLQNWRRPNGLKADPSFRNELWLERFVQNKL